jgi:hypothetical protein
METMTDLSRPTSASNLGDISQEMGHGKMMMDAFGLWAELMM